MRLTINPYDEDRCRSLVESKFLSNIRKKFGTSCYLLYDKVAVDRDLRIRKTLNPREASAIGIVPCGIFYYIDYLNPDDNTIVDVGCGANLFKDVVPNIYGIDPNGTLCDENDFFDIEGNFARKHYQEFSAAMAIDSLHFTSLLNFSSQVTLFASMITPGGRGLVTFNAARMVERTPKDELFRLFGTAKPYPLHIENYFDEEIKKLVMNFIIVDNFVRVAYNECVDGNVRLVFEV
jgi:hypothetical protein